MGRVAGFEKIVALNAPDARVRKFVMRPFIVAHELWKPVGTGKPTIRVPHGDLKILIEHASLWFGNFESAAPIPSDPRLVSARA